MKERKKLLQEMPKNLTKPGRQESGLRRSRRTMAVTPPPVISIGLS